MFDTPLFKRNNALQYNPGMAGEDITVRGSDFYFAVCAIMGFSALVFVGMMFRVPRSARIFHYITVTIVVVACVAYYTMGSNLGTTPVRVEFVRSGAGRGGPTRSVFYARYIDWVITTPLILLDIMLTAGLPWSTILFTIAMDEVMIVTGLVGALVSDVYKWGFFAFGCAAFLLVAWNIAVPGVTAARAIGDDIGRLYITMVALTSVLWFLYPIAWGLSEGGNYIHPDSEAVFYGVLDVLAKPVFGFITLWGHRKLDPTRLGIVYDTIPGANARQEGVKGNS